MRDLESSNSQNRKWKGGCQGLRGGRMESLISMELQFCKMKKVLEMDGGDGSRAM